MKLVMMGTGSFAEPTFRKLLESSHRVVGLVTQPDRATGSQRGSTRQAGQPMKELAIERGIPVLQPESINTPDGVTALRALNPDLVVVAAYGQILSKDILSVAPLGGINVHASLLPKYRGAAPINWAIYHGETQSGVTIIRMTTGLDAGDMLVQEAIDILPNETAGELEARLGPLGAKLAIETVDKLAQGPSAGVPQDKGQVTKAPKLTKEHGLIDWSRPAAGVVNQIRAMQPWPTAYTYLHRQGHEPLRVIVCSAMVTGRASDGIVGQAVADGSRLFACSADGWIEIIELQPAGKRRMSAQDFLRGNAIPPDARFGSENA
ncbi:MAG: methionyl-tRNA formyltransferase [Planctomycetes bacterium]|nr:methionyl-tRNA formyltransferase [Planctomycetota bacterium]